MKEKAHVQILYHTTNYNELDLISNILFFDIKNTGSAGGAIYISRLTAEVVLEDNIFKNCSTDKTSNTVNKTPCSSGGAFIDARQVNASRIMFCKCSGTKLEGNYASGGSYYAGGDSSMYGSFVLCSDHLSNGNNAVRLDLMKIDVENSNVSKPSVNTYEGSLHIGNHPPRLNVKYLVISQALWGLGTSLKDKTTMSFHHIGFSNCTGNGALVITMSINVEIFNLETFGCSNNLWYNRDGKLTLIDSWVKGVNTQGVIFQGSNSVGHEKFLTLPYEVVYSGRKCKNATRRLPVVPSMVSALNLLFR